MSNKQAYKHSGKVGLFPLAFPIALLPTMLILAAIYSAILIYVPFVGYVSFLLVLGTGIAIGFATGGLAKATNCRNPLVVAGAGATAGAAFLWLSWIAFLALLDGSGYPAPPPKELAMYPGVLFETISKLASTGWYTIFGFTPKGFVLAVFWLLEAIILVAVPAVTSAGLIGDEMFCESCSKWCERAEPVRLDVGGDDSGTMKRLVGGDFAAVRDLRAVGDEFSAPARVVTYLCAGCTQTTGYAIDSVETTTASDGQVKEEFTRLTPIFVLERVALRSLPAKSATMPHPEGNSPLPDDASPADHS